MASCVAAPAGACIIEADFQRGFAMLPYNTAGCKIAGVVGDADVPSPYAIGTGGSAAAVWIDVRGWNVSVATTASFAGTAITFEHSYDGITSNGLLYNEAGAAVKLTAGKSRTIVPCGTAAVALGKVYFIRPIISPVQGTVDTTLLIGRTY